MVLSMLSAIQNVKLPSSTSASNSSSSSQEQTKKEQSQLTTRVADMSRRKQRNPKPIFNSENSDQEKESNTETRVKQASSDEDSNIQEEIHSMIKVEVHELKAATPTPPPLSQSAPPPQATPPPSTSNATPLPRLGMPPLHLTAGLRPSAEQLMLNHTSEMLAKQNMFFFGDVNVAEHPDAPPVPMVIPMVYLYPLPSLNKENIKYRMFVPLGGGMGPEMLVPPLVPPMPPHINLPKLEKARSESDLELRRSGDTTPLDLSKSPDSSINQANHNTSDSEDLAEPSLPPPLKKGPSSMLQKSEEDLSKSQQREIEAQLQFIKAKQLEFFKGHQQKLAAQAAAAAAAAAAVVQKSRCEECNINFSKHQNYIAHKKYYCSSASSSATAPSASNGGKPTLPILSDNEDDKSSSDEGSKSQQQPRRKLSPVASVAPPTSSPSLILAGLASPPLKDRKEAEVSGKDLLMLKQQQDLLKDSSCSESSSKSQISPGGLIMAPGLTTPPLPHFVCEGCGIKFKSVSNLQAHQARYCAGLRKASEDAFEALLMKQKQQQQQAQQQKAAAALPMLEMMSLLNAKSNMEQQDKFSSLMMSSMAAALANSNNKPTPPVVSSNSEDYCCILCGYKEQSVERLKDHINLHFIGQVKRKHEEVVSSSSADSGSKRAKVVKEEVLAGAHPPDAEDDAEEASNVRSSDDEQQQLKCSSCDIGFSHLSNFVAHKKYYCRGIQSAAAAAIRNISPKSDRGESPSK